MTLLLAAMLFAEFPPSCATPDGMAVDPRGRLVIAAPNFADVTKPGVLFRIDRPGGKPYVWTTVPVNPKTGHACPMGISFGDRGELYVCDNQSKFARYEGRLLKLEFADDRLVKTTVIARGMESPNGCKFRDGKIWMTQSSVKLLDQGAGTLASGVYRFDPARDENVFITNSREDPNLVIEVETENRHGTGGANALAFGAKGELYFSNFGDGAVMRAEFNPDGTPKSVGEFAVTDFDYRLDPKAAGFEALAGRAKMRSADGLAFGSDGTLYVADFRNHAVCAVSPQGEITVVEQAKAGDRTPGAFVNPSEIVFWQGHMVIANFGSRSPSTLSELKPAK